MFKVGDTLQHSNGGKVVSGMTDKRGSACESQTHINWFIMKENEEEMRFHFGMTE